MSDWHELGEHDGSYTVAGWEYIGGEWNDVENGATPLENYSSHIDSVAMVTFHYVSQGGDDVYFTIHGPWEDWDSMESYIEYALDSYLVEG